METLKCVIADDNERMLQLLGAIVSGEDDFEVVGTGVQADQGEGTGCGADGCCYAETGWTGSSKADQ